MKATLEFNLPEDKEEMENAIKGGFNKMKIDTLYDEVFRPHIKYGTPITDGDLTDEQLTIIESIWEKVFNHFEDTNE